MKDLLLIGLGGGVGSMLRYLTSVAVTNRFSGSVFPFGTLVVNVLGCIVIGIAYGLASRYDWFTPQMRLVMATGLCGGYTTFSAFAYENLSLLQSENYLLSFVYIVASLALCLVATFLGIWLIKLF